MIKIVNKELLLYFLLVIRKSNDIWSLNSVYGAYQVEINKIYLYCFEKGYTIEVDEDIIITKRGSNKIKNLQKELKIKGIERFVMPDKTYFKEAISPDMVYIPNKK